MDIQTVLNYFTQYGLIFLFVIVLLEYMNLPGLPAGIIMPAAGILIAGRDMNFITALIVSVLAGLLGSYILYFIGYFLGKPVLDKFYQKYKKLRPSINKAISYTEKHGSKGVFIARLIPVARTLISLTVGTMRMNFLSFTIYSILGITIWNSVFIYAGYAFGYLF
ncbi:MAG: DedA family protein [Turicibacter sp.]|nr:DedA family protein [Turicibacter sp.]MBQ1786475.1 DedA family protein [Turicibacter sp.]